MKVRLVKLQYSKCNLLVKNHDETVKIVNCRVLSLQQTSTYFGLVILQPSNKWPNKASPNYAYKLSLIFVEHQPALLSYNEASSAEGTRQMCMKDLLKVHTLRPSQSRVAQNCTLHSLGKESVEMECKIIGTSIYRQHY